MALFQPARWRGPISNQNTGAMVRPLQGLVLHIQQGHEVGTDAKFRAVGDPNPASAHFGNPFAGSLDQWVDTNDMAWAQMAGNPSWISVENEGNTGDSLSANQLSNAALLLAWLHLTENIPLQPADTPSDSGLGSHGMGGAAWGNHPNCPGQPILDQRAAIISAAQSLVAAPIVTSITPMTGPVGTTITIAGSGFTFATSVGFGSAEPAQVSFDSDTQITIVAPNATGTAPIVVTTLVGTTATSDAATFTFADVSPVVAPPAPAVTTISPATGTPDGGFTVVITGSAFTGATSVGFGGTSVPALNVDSDAQITVTAPAGAAGTVDVIVVTPAGLSPSIVADQFTYA